MSFVLEGTTQNTLHNINIKIYMSYAGTVKPMAYPASCVGSVLHTQICKYTNTFCSPGLYFVHNFLDLPTQVFFFFFLHYTICLHVISNCNCFQEHFWRNYAKIVCKFWKSYWQDSDKNQYPSPALAPVLFPSISSSLRSFFFTPSLHHQVF